MQNSKRCNVNRPQETERLVLNLEANSRTFGQGTSFTFDSRQKASVKGVQMCTKNT